MKSLYARIVDNDIKVWKELGISEQEYRENKRDLDSKFYADVYRGDRELKYHTHENPHGGWTPMSSRVNLA